MFRYFCSLWGGAEVGVNVEGKKIEYLEKDYLDWEGSSSANDDDDDSDSGDGGCNPMTYILKIKFN